MINWTRIQELYEDFGADGAEDLFAAFLEETQEGMDRLEAATTPDTLQSEFHFLKGAALNMGFDEVSALCEQGEQLARDGQDASEFKARVLAVLPATCAQFRQEWRSRVGLG